MNPSIWTAIQPIASQAARDFLRTVGMGLAAHGYITNGANVEAFVGAGMTLAGLFWGWFTTSGYIQLAGLLKKLTATKTQANAVIAAQVLPPAAAVDTQSKAVSVQSVVRVMLLACLLSSLFVPVAFAQTGNIVRDIAAARARVGVKPVAPAATVATPAPVPTPATDSLSKLMTDLANVEQTVITGVIADITAADADAATLNDPNDPTSFKDPISHACYPAEIKFLQSLPVASAPTGTFVVVQLFQKKRDFVAQIQAGLPNYLKLGCAALLGDEVKILTTSLGLIGVTVAANSLLPGSGFVIPTL